jgi:hypothetical protein
MWSVNDLLAIIYTITFVLGLLLLSMILRVQCFIEVPTFQIVNSKQFYFTTIFFIIFYEIYCTLPQQRAGYHLVLIVTLQ